MSTIRAKGFVEAVVFDKLGRVRVRSKRAKNMILDQGLLGIATRSWAKSFEYCAIGSSTSDTSNDQVMLGSEFDRTDNYDITLGTCGSSIGENTVYLWRSFRFPTHIGAPITWGEVGMSWSAQPKAANLFSRLSTAEIFDGSPIQLVEGDRVQVGYSLALTLSPASATPAVTTLGISTLSPNTAHHNWQSICLDGVDVNGQTVANMGDESGGTSCMEPSAPGKVMLSSSTELSAFPFDADRRTTSFFKDLTPGTPVRQMDGTVRLEKTVLVAPGDATGQVVNAIGITSTDVPGLFSGYVAVLDTPVTLGAASSLNLTFTQSWGRA